MNKNVRSSLIDLALNIIIPYGIYHAAKQYFGASEITALTLSSLYPLFDTVREFLRDRTLNFISAVVLLGTITGIIGALLGGSPKLILIRESFFSILLGVASIISLATERPLMFYFAREYVAGKDPKERQEFTKILQIKKVRTIFQTITLVWGIVFIAEFLLKVLLVNIFSSSQVLIIGPITTYAVTILALLWTFWYSSRQKEKYSNK